MAAATPSGPERKQRKTERKKEYADRGLCWGSRVDARQGVSSKRRNVEREIGKKET
jgi:hypothetical protein